MSPTIYLLHNNINKLSDEKKSISKKTPIYRANAYRTIAYSLIIGDSDPKIGIDTNWA